MRPAYGLPPLALAAGKLEFDAVGSGSDRENIAVVEALLRHGANVNMPAPPTGEAPLCRAVEAFRPATVHLLLAHGARVDLRFSGVLV
jgi:ankyrin repeat protein